MRVISRPIVGAFLAVAAPAAASAQSAPATQAAPDPAELAEARAIMEIAFPTAERDATFGTMLDQLLKQFRQTIPLDVLSDPGLDALVNAHLDSLPGRLMPTIKVHLPKIIEATAVAYTGEFSLTELKEIHAFARTDTGKHYLSTTAKLVGDPAVAAANTAYMMDLRDLQKSATEALTQELISYLEANPEVLEKPRAATTN